MAAFKPELYSIPEILAYYENSGLVNYRVYAGSKPDIMYCRYEYDGGDLQQGQQLLHDALQAIQSNSLNTNTYLLQLIKHKPTKGAAANKVLDGINITFQLNTGNTLQPMQAVGGMDFQTRDLLQKLMQQNERLIENQARLEQRLNDIESGEVEDEKEPGIMGAIGSMLENPEIQMAIVGKLMEFLTPKPQIQNEPRN